MQEEFYCILKLVSGEELFALVMVEDPNEEEDPIIVLQNPILITLMSGNMGVFIRCRRWMELSDEDIFFIRKSKIITMTESKNDMLINYYNEYTKDNKDSDFIDDQRKVKISGNMGYIASVDEARKLLEDIYKNLE